jgi:hypothetical protein
VIGFIDPSIIPLCFAPETTQGITVVCPTAEANIKSDGASATTGAEIDSVMDDTANRWDLFTIEALGLAAAAISGAVALRNIRGTCSPVGIPVSLAILKLPLGSLTAVLGLLLMRGGFVPGLSALDSPQQILAWAVLFGYAQQIFTRLVDQQAHTVLEHVKVNVPEDAALEESADRPGGARAALAASPRGPAHPRPRGRHR